MFQQKVLLKLINTYTLPYDFLYDTMYVPILAECMREGQLTRRKFLKKVLLFQIYLSTGIQGIY